MLKQITLRFPIYIIKLDLPLRIPVIYLVDTDDLSEIVTLLAGSPKKYYDGNFTEGEIKFLKNYYDKIDDAYLNPPKKLTKKELAKVKRYCAKQKTFFNEHIFDKQTVAREDISLRFDYVESITKEDNDTYWVFAHDL